jgi:hypothetical protein
MVRVDFDEFFLDIVLMPASFQVIAQEDEIVLKGSISQGALHSKYGYYWYYWYY